MAIQLLISDVTELHAGAFCVAGWCAASGRMVRPLPNGRFWSPDLLRRHRIELGSVVGVIPTGSPGSGCYPHQTEDEAVAATSIGVASASGAAWFGVGAPPCSTSVADAFEHHVEANRESGGTILGAFVRKDVQTRSLWGVRVQRSTMQFSEPQPGKLKVLLRDRVSRYNLPVSSRRLKAVWREGGLGALERLLPVGGDVHLRVGLARAFGSPPDQCFLMLNDIHW